MKYAVKLKDGKIVSYQPISEKYLVAFADDENNPLNKGFTLVDNLDLLVRETEPISTSLQEQIDALEIRIGNLEKIKEP